MLQKKSCSLNSPVTLAAALAVVLAAAIAAAEDNPVVRTADSPELEWGPCPDFMPEGCAIAVLHGNPAEPDADLFFKVPGGADIPRHTHTSPERIVLVSGELQVRYEGHEQQTLEPGAYAYGPAGVPHDGACISDEDCILFIAFVDPVDAMPAGDSSL
ncbi:MAG TPA: cupin domain-containing protein [Woeseiaceae bacterium]|nr:cupin domain-containing protein [Woeseiaceae bacterium]